jgi:uncharacterized protein (TIGR03643 family)
LAILQNISLRDKDRFKKMAWEYRTSFEAIEMKLDLKQHDLIKLIWKEMKASRFKLLRVRTRGRSVKHEAVRRDEKDRFKYSRKKKSQSQYNH